MSAKWSTKNAVTTIADADQLYGVQSGTNKRFEWSTLKLFLGAVANPYQFGAVGDGSTDDTAAVQAAIDTGCCFIPAATFKTTDNLSMPDGGKVFGLGFDSVIKPVGVTGGAFQEDFLAALPNGPFRTNVSIRDIRIAGTATNAIQWEGVITCDLRNITTDGGTYTDAFLFQCVFGATLDLLFTNGASVSNACFKVGGVFNTNVCNLWYASALCTYGIYCEDYESIGGSGGNVFNGMSIQNCTTGLYVGLNFGASTYKATYTENVVHPVVLGDYANSKYCNSIHIDGGVFGGPSDSHASYSSRLAVFDINYAVGCKITLPNFDGAYNIATFAPVTFSGGGGTGAKAIIYVRQDGTLSQSYQIIDGGSSYSSDPTVAVAGTGTGETVTASRTGNVVTGLTVSSRGSGFTCDRMIPIIYTAAYNVEIDGRFFNNGAHGILSALWPWVCRSSTAQSDAGISIQNDRMWDPTPYYTAEANVQRAEGYGYQHYVKWINSAGTEQSKSFVPAVYPN